jgi:hypothetical protein
LGHRAKKLDLKPLLLDSLGKPMNNEPARSAQITEQILLLRLLVGYLGQRKQYGWWDCDFLDSTGLRFLETTFPRTAWAAALRSTSEAACIVHDQALGRIGSYHLFRFPPVLEDQIEHSCDKLNWAEVSGHIGSRDMAMEALKSLASNFIKAPPGPVQVGVEKRILTNNAIRELAAHYHSAFQDGIRCFPYFAPEKNEH